MTLRLVHLASQTWGRLDGLMASQGVDTLSLPFDRFLSVTYWWVTKGATQAEIDKFDARLWMPPIGVIPTQGPWTPAAETAAFKGLKASLNATRSGA